MVPKEGRLCYLRALKDGALGSVRFRLAKAIAAGDDDELTLEDFTECDFDGYAEIVGGWDGDPVINGDERGQLDSVEKVWTAGPDIAAPQTIEAVYIVVDFGVADEQLYWFKRLSPTVTLAAEDEELRRVIRLLADDLGI